jgi:hypothetical protein
METGRPPSDAPATAAWPDPTRHVTLNSPCHWWECADIKTDAPPDWQLLPDEIDYLRFETRLVHESPDVGDQHRVYVQVHNRGPLPATDVVVTAMTTAASAGLPDLPADFWTSWPDSTGDAHWAPLGAPRTIAILEPLRPTVLEWTWTPLPGTDAHTSVLVIVDSASDPIPDEAKVLDVATLVTGEKRVGLSNLHLVDAPPDVFAPVPLRLHAPDRPGTDLVLRLPALDDPRLDVGLLLTHESSSRARSGAGAVGLISVEFLADDLGRLRHRWVSEEMRPEDSWDRLLETFDVEHLFRVDRGRLYAELPLGISAGERDQVLLMVRGRGDSRPPDPPARFTVLQRTTTGDVVGGGTFLLRPVAG